MAENTRNQNRLIDLPKTAVRYAAYKWYAKQGNSLGMYHNYKYLEPIKKNNPNYYFNLSKLASHEKKWEQSLQYINKAIELRTKDEKVEYFFYKSKILLKQNKVKEALTLLESYLKSYPNNKEALLLLGNERYKLKEWKNALNVYEQYLQINAQDTQIIYNTAECYRFVDNYKRAEKKYKQLVEYIQLIKDQQKKAEIYYLFGLMKLLTNPEEDVSDLFDKCLYFDCKRNSEVFGIGVFHEAFYQYDKAIVAYKKDLDKNQDNHLLLYRLASLLDKLNNVEEAVLYYHQALQLYKADANWHYALGLCYEKMADYTNAALWYKSAKDRYLNHNEEVIRRYANVLSKSGRIDEACEAYQEANLFKKPILATNAQQKNNINKKTVRYAISYEFYNVESNIIFYESLGGARMMGNPYAIYEQILDHKDFKEFVHVWVVKSFAVIPNEFQNLDNVIFVKKNTDAYAKYISKAKYLICNSTFESFVTRKPNQLYLQTSHGVFYKTVGRDSSRSPLGVAGATRNLLQATHIIVPNEFMAEKQPKSYSIQGIHTGEIAKIGYPRIDVTKETTEKNKNHIISRLGLEANKKTVVYAPTWRGATKSQNRFDTEKLISDLKKMAELDINVVFRGHTISNTLLKGIEIPDNIIIPPSDIQTNELLNIADITISDYSSVFFDFLVTERPIIHYLYDIEEYSRERGLNLGVNELPGSIAYTIDELTREIENKMQNPEPNALYLKAKQRFSPYDDGFSSERVVKWFFYGKTDGIEFVNKKENKETYLVLGGRLADKKNLNELIDYLNNLIEEEKSVSVLIDKSIIQDQEKFGLVKQLNSNINFIVHDPNTPRTIQEISAIAATQNRNKYSSNLLEETKISSYSREIRRLLGDTRFDHIVNFEKHDYYWNQLEYLLMD